jgi:hypothetical protein
VIYAKSGCRKAVEISKLSKRGTAKTRGKKERRKEGEEKGEEGGREGRNGRVGEQYTWIPFNYVYLSLPQSTPETMALFRRHANQVFCTSSPPPKVKICSPSLPQHVTYHLITTKMAHVFAML